MPGATDPSRTDASRGSLLSAPNFSVRNRLSGRIATGSSIFPRRHASSHGAAHTRPHTDANGFGPRATRKASRSFPCAISVTYAPASVPTGHAAAHGTLRWNACASGTAAGNGGPVGTTASRTASGRRGRIPAAVRSGATSRPARSSASRARPNVSGCHGALTCGFDAAASRSASSQRPSRRHACAAS